MRTATTLKEYVDHQDEVTEIDISTFDKYELRGLAAKLSKFKKLPNFKIVGLPKKEMIIDNNKSILTLLSSVNWHLTKDQQDTIREELLIEPWYLGSVFNLFLPLLAAETDWILQINLGLDLTNKVFDGSFPATWAASLGLEKALMLMIKKRPQVLTEKDDRGETPGFIMARGSYEKTFLSMVDENPEILKEKDKHGVMLIDKILSSFNPDIREKTVMSIIKKHPECLKYKDENGATTLMRVVSPFFPLNRYYVLQFVIEDSPTVLEDADDNGNTLAMYAAEKGAKGSLVWILYGMLGNELDKDTTGLNQALQIMLNKNMFSEAKATSKEELLSWLLDTMNTSIKAQQVKDIIRHFHVMASEKKREKGNFGIIDTLPFDAPLSLDIYQKIAFQLIKPVHFGKFLLSEEEMGTVIQYLLGKKGNIKKGLEESLQDLLKELNIDRPVKFRTEGKEEEEEDIEPKGQKKI